MVVVELSVGFDKMVGDGLDLWRDWMESWMLKNCRLSRMSCCLSMIWETNQVMHLLEIVFVVVAFLWRITVAREYYNYYYYYNNYYCCCCCCYYYYFYYCYYIYCYYCCYYYCYYCCYSNCYYCCYSCCYSCCSCCCCYCCYYYYYYY